MANKFIRETLRNVKYHFSKLDFLGALNSPLRGLKLRFYFGEIRIGTPIFFPRKWVKSEGGRIAVPIKHFGMGFIGLGWKLKYDDCRFEWSPMFWAVIFGKQFVAWVVPNIDDDCYQDDYWECWLTYKRKTSGTKLERLGQLYERYDSLWTVYKDGEKRTVDYIPYMIKDKWLKRSGYGKEKLEKRNEAEQHRAQKE